MSAKYLMGIDVGTYSAKGVLVRPDGRVLASHTVDYDLSIPRPGWAEHDADQIWWRSVVEIAPALIAKAQVDSRQITAIGCSAIGATMLPVDKQGRPLRPSILYGIDTRATQEIEALNAALGRERIMEINGSELSAQSIGPKILWFRKHEPERFEQTHKIVTASTYLTYKLTGRFVIDNYTAPDFAPMYSIQDRAWNQEMCGPVCDPDLLPEPVWTTEVVGAVTAAAAAETGLAEGTPVIAGTTDAGAEAVSVGVADPGDTMLMYGSTLFMVQAVGEWLRAPGVWSGLYCLPDTYSVTAGMGTSGSLTRWFRDNFGQAELDVERQLGIDAYHLLAQGATDTSPGSNGLVVLPYFSGERTPINDPRARGLIAGLTLSHTRQDVYRALLEGVGYGVRHNLEAMAAGGAPPQRLLAVGGGAKNPLWLQIISDILGKPQEVAATTIGASYGDAYLAGYGAGLFSDFSTLKEEWVTIHQVVEPRPKAHQLYNDYYAVYLQCYRQLQQQMHVLADLGDAAGGE